MNCSACGFAIPSDASFCPKCGAKSGDMMPPKPGAAPTSPLQPSATGDDVENLLWEGSYSGKAMVGTWLMGFVISVVLIVAGALYPPGLYVCLGLFALIWITLGLVLVRRKLGVHYELTTQRFIHKTGILSRRTDRIETIDIDDVTVVQGLVERMFGVGSIKIVSTDRTDPELVLRGIDDVKRIADLIDDARRQERRKHAVHIESI